MKYFFVFVIPVLWIAASLVSYKYPGEELEVYVYANIIGVWPFFLIPLEGLSSWVMPAGTAVVGGLILAAAGFGMDKLRVSRLIWAILWASLTVLLLLIMLNYYNSVKENLPPGNPLAVYVPGCMNVAIYLSVIISTVIRLIGLFVGRTRVLEPKLIYHEA